MEITLKENKIYLFLEDGKRKMLFKSEIIRYSNSIFRLILRNQDEKETNVEIRIYLKLISSVPTHSSYCARLNKKLLPTTL